MGPLRRQLILLWLTASPAFAGVCEAYRPGWTAGDGATTALDEALAFILSGAGAVLIVALIAGWVLRQKMILNGVILAALVFAFPRLWPLDPATLQLAIGEGCAGPSHIVLTLLAIIWFGGLAGLLLRRKGG
jgi:hypothetical protein